ncbi:MAG: acyl-CoA dehydrogenase, partial [Deltaproteobacteria bacterium]
MDFELTEEQLALRELLLRVGREKLAPRAIDADRSGTFDREAWSLLGELGVLGLPIAQEYGGSGADVTTCVVAGEALGESGADGGLLLSWGAHTFLCAATIQSHGTEEQKKKYLPKLATGEWIGCMGLTEPGAGSDAASLRTRARQEGDGWRLDGSKIFITNGPIADVAVVFATADPSLGHEGLCAFIVEKGTEGFSAGKPLDK